MDHSARASITALGRRLLTVLAATTVGALALLAVATGVTTQRLGTTERAMRARVERAVRATFAQGVEATRLEARRVASLASLPQAVGGDPAAQQRLFTELAPRGSADDGVGAVTVFDADNQPVAWAGRPTDVPIERLRARRDDWFVAEGALGLRLVHVAPIDAPRAGAVVVERDVATVVSGPATGIPGSVGEGYQTATPWAPVTLEIDARGGLTSTDPSRFDVTGPGGRPLVTALVDTDDLARTRARWVAATRWLILLALVVGVLVCVGAVLDWRAQAFDAFPSASAAGLLALIWLARSLLLIEPLGNWLSSPLVTSVVYASGSALRLLASPLDFVLTAVAAAASTIVVLVWTERLRRQRERRRTVRLLSDWLTFGLHAVAGGLAVAGILWVHGWILRDTVEASTVDLSRLSLAPLNAPRLALQLGLVGWHACAVGAMLVCCRASTIPWLVRRASLPMVAAVAAWTIPSVAVFLRLWPRPFPALAVAIVLALLAPGLWARYRNGSQAFRLVAGALALVVPSLAFYPTMFQLSWRAKSRLVESRYAPQALNQRRTLYALLEASLREIDSAPGLQPLVTAPRADSEATPSTTRSFQIWRATALARYPATSSVEVYGRDGSLISRFAFNLPEDLSAAPRSDESSCEWTVAEEVAPFFAEERRIYHAGRALCGANGAVQGSIVVHAMLDYENLPFIAARTPSVQLLQRADAVRGPDAHADDLQYAVYGWSRTPLYSSHESAWPLDDAVFELVEQSRDPVWARLRRNGVPFDVYLLNDRGGIYALGLPAVSAFGHLVNLAEVTLLAAVGFLTLTVAAALFSSAARRTKPATALLREIRVSFYRKLFLAFVAAVVAPVALLAFVARTFVANEMRAGVEREALRTSAAASRVVADLIVPRATPQGSVLDDNLMVWVSRLIDEDANIFVGSALAATSERTVFASGLFPGRTPADIYQALYLRREATAVARERIGDFEYVVAAAPIRFGAVDAVMTVPLTTRQREIDLQIEALDRRVLLAALLFMAIGAAAGYTMAERIADPVNRLTRATKRIAGGDFDVRIASSSADEFATLVGDFNRMAAELQHQRSELERTHRIGAWAEMARQVAHDIKNPLTPIQLNAEHLRRVHADRGEPLGPILQECVGTILAQVALLRQISSEFSNFASSPSVRRAPVDTEALLDELVAPYARGLAAGTTIVVERASPLPLVDVDRGLVMRALTNVIENALHAMPGGGTLTIRAGTGDADVRIDVSDTGVGMDVDALARAFEPYFSTKARGTGLGLPIAKRNIELSGGTIAVASERAIGTTVTVHLPLAAV